MLQTIYNYDSTILCTVHRNKKFKSKYFCEKVNREFKNGDNTEVTHQLIQLNPQWILFAASVESVRKCSSISS